MRSGRFMVGVLSGIEVVTPRRAAQPRGARGKGARGREGVQGTGAKSLAVNPEA